MSGGLDARVIGDAREFSTALRADLRDSTQLAIAVAFAKESVVSALDVEQWCQSGRNLRLLAGVDYALTELELLRRLEATGGAQCRVFHSVGTGVFHPKLYILEKVGRRVVYVGSSNFTRGGFLDNIEANVRLEGPTGAPAVEEANRVFTGLFDGEFATPVLPEFEAGYRELQDMVRTVRANPTVPELALRFHMAESLLLGRYRARVAVGRWLLVTSPTNFEICMRERVWGRQDEAEVRRYAPGDVFFFHVTELGRVLAFGMFTGSPYLDPRPLWPATERGTFPWRIRFISLGLLGLGIPTREVLAPLRMAAPARWFHGFIQQSHALSDADFEALREAFEAALRRQQTDRFR
jgi:HKD family nuclease